VTSTPGTSSGRRKVIRLENSSPEENTEYPPLPDKKTWDDILKDVQKPEVPEELDTPPSQRREPAKESTPGSGQRLNFNNVNPDPAPAKETFVLKISEADAEAEVDAEPENEEEGEKTVPPLKDSKVRRRGSDSRRRGLLIGRSSERISRNSFSFCVCFSGVSSDVLYFSEPDPN
jgi:hypothetical protein